MADTVQNANKSYAETRAALLRRGFTLASWARARRHRPSTVYDSVKGLRHGLVATKIRYQLEKFLNA